MGDEDLLIIIPRVSKFPIPLFTVCIRFYFAIEAGTWSCFYEGLFSVRGDTDAAHIAVYSAIVGDIEAIPVVGVMGHEVQGCTFVQDNRINNLIHSTGSLVQRRCCNSNPVQR